MRTKMAMAIGVMATAVGLLAMTTPASAAVVWDVKSNWANHHLSPGGEGKFYIQVRNLGDTGSVGPTTITVDLPPGVSAPDLSGFNWLPYAVDGDKDFEWGVCSGTDVVTCTSEEAIGAQYGVENYGYARRLYFPVNVDENAVEGTYELKVTVSGSSTTGAEDVDPITISSTPAPFGMVDGSFEGDTFAAREPSPERERQAVSHPYELRVDFDMNLKAAREESATRMIVTPVERLKTVETTLPPGLLGNPEAVPKCTASQFTSGGESPLCPPDSQVGVIDVILSAGADPYGDFGIFNFGGFMNRIPVYNLVPPDGSAADFGFSVRGIRSHIFASLDPSQDYAISALTPFIPAPFGYLDIRQVRFTMWGVPADPRHNKLRWPGNGPSNSSFEEAGGGFPDGIPSTAPKRPFLTLGADCARGETFKQRVESYENAGKFTDRVVATGPSMHPEGCDDPRIRFEPDVKLQPTARAAGGPTGLAVSLLVPQRDDEVADVAELYPQSGDMQAIATPPMKKAVVTFPEGMTISTSAAQGLGNCSLEQMALGTNKPVSCPDSSQYGTLTIETPILPADEPMTGYIYIAKQNDNPFSSFLALYLVIQDLRRGLLLKIPARVDLDPVTGQIKTTFDELPQFPVSNMEMKFKGGVRAALVNPTTCGTKTIRAEFFSYAQPNSPVVVNDNYEIARKPDGSLCVNSLGERPFRPAMEAGTISNSAGSYSPFTYRVQRSDDDQEFSQLDVKLPKGLLANISGVSKCPEAAINAAVGRTGTEEANSPSCPASSQIGTTDVGSGVGQVITYIPGKAYLSGPYRGAPLSMVVITPILAGPYDLGVIAVRSRIQVNTDTTEASVQTDPFPQIFKGIPVRIRDIRVKVDRQNTIVNPTNCNPMSIGSLLTGTGGDVNTTADDTAASLSSRFQASNCENLPFKPDLRFELRGGTNRGDYPALTATLRGRPGDANIASARVTLPPSAFLAQEHIRTVCTRVQFAAEKCPEASIYGHASAKSPLFDQTLEGPVYLRSSSNKLPDLVATLNGDIDVVLVGRIDSTKKGGIRNTFDVVPDAPVEKFVLRMQGGKKGLLVNSRNLCKTTNRADSRMVGQNGKQSKTSPLVVAKGCKGKKRGGAKAKAKGGKR